MRSQQSRLGLLFVWVRHHNRMFWRTPIAAFFTLVLPLFMMSLFSSIFSGDIYSSGEASLSVAGFFVPSLACFTAASATYTNISISVTIYREEGILKRVCGTPTPKWLYILAAVLSASWIAFLGTALMLIVGILAFDVEIVSGQLYWLPIFFFIGVMVFSVLGLAVSTISSSARAAPAIANATILPLAFVSNIFIYLESPPKWVEISGDIFPLKSFSEGFRRGFDTQLQDGAILDLVVMLAWGLAAFIFTLKYFIWLPKVETSRGTREMKSKIA